VIYGKEPGLLHNPSQSVLATRATQPAINKSSTVPRYHRNRMVPTSGHAPSVLTLPGGQVNAWAIRWPSAQRATNGSICDRFLMPKLNKAATSGDQTITIRERLPRPIGEKPQRDSPIPHSVWHSSATPNGTGYESHQGQSSSALALSLPDAKRCQMIATEQGYRNFSDWVREALESSESVTAEYRRAGPQRAANLAMEHRPSTRLED